ncbi:MAG: gephyrin-like molybdotransferase Glp [Wenzhouxiangella sp.]
MSNFHAVGDARARLLAAVEPVCASVETPLDDALGRVLAGSARAVTDVPPADNSSMDGYAFKRTELHGTDSGLPLSARVHAGQSPAPLESGTAVRIFTGAVIPEGADTVAMQENCREADGRVSVDPLPEAGANIRRAGEDLRAGEVIIEAGRRLQPQDLGLLASTGIDRVAVFEPLVVAILSTGDELVPPGRALAPGQIYNSNASVLAGLLHRLGCKVITADSVADTADATRAALERAAGQADLVISSGGVSVGEADHVKNTVAEIGQLDLWKISVKPGKPLAFGRIGTTPFLGLPGNPVSVFVTFCLFAAPVIRRMQGRADALPEPLPVPAGFAIDKPGNREEYLRVRVESGKIVPYPHQGSGVLSSVAWAHGLAKIPIGSTVAPGDRVEYFGFEALLN